MSTIRCPYCGHRNVSLRRTCDNCHMALAAPELDLSPAATPEATPSRRTLWDNVADFLIYVDYQPRSFQINLDGFLADLQRMKPDLPALTAAEGWRSPKLPRLDTPEFGLQAPDLPEIDLSITVSYLANLRLPEPDFTPAIEFLSTLRLPGVDLPALADLLPHIDLSAVDLPALVDLLPHIDLSTVDLPALGELLSGIDLPSVDPAFLGDLLSAVDLTAVDLDGLADLLSGVDWSVLAEGLSEIDISALFDLLEGIDF